MLSLSSARGPRTSSLSMTLVISLPRFGMPLKHASAVASKAQRRVGVFGEASRITKRPREGGRRTFRDVCLNSVRIHRSWQMAILSHAALLWTRWVPSDRSNRRYWPQRFSLEGVKPERTAARLSALAWHYVPDPPLPSGTSSTDLRARLEFPRAGALSALICDESLQFRLASSGAGTPAHVHRRTRTCPAEAAPFRRSLPACEDGYQGGDDRRDDGHEPAQDVQAGSCGVFHGVADDRGFVTLGALARVLLVIALLFLDPLFGVVPSAGDLLRPGDGLSIPGTDILRNSVSYAPVSWRDTKPEKSAPST